MKKTFQIIKIMTACVNKFAYTSSSSGEICLTIKVVENMRGNVGL